MKIAVTSQNRKSVTEHAGRCRKFWVFEIEHGKVLDKRLLELSKEQSLHESSPHEAHPLDDVDVLIVGGMGPGLMARLARKGIKGVVIKEADPEQAVSRFLEGSLASVEPQQHLDGHHEA